VGKSLVSGEQYEQHLKNLVNELGIGEQVSFLGHLLNPQPIYCISDVVVVPSLWLEAFGRVVAEAMACGTPVIASRVGGIPEILTDRFQDYLVEPGDEADLFHALKQTIGWKDNHPELGQQCREHILQKFNLEQMNNEIETVLLKTLAARKKQ
jgi:glycosyltransferase involved in cell wall biosynthesis